MPFEKKKKSLIIVNDETIKQPLTYANPFPTLSIKNTSTYCVRQDRTAHNVSIAIDPKITFRLPFASPQIPQKYAPNNIPKNKKKKCLTLAQWLLTGVP